MFSLFKKISLFLLAVVVFIATSGMTIYHHHCACSDISETSVIIQKFDCAHFNDQNTPQEHSCCHAVDPETPDHSEDDEDGCCTTTHDFLKIGIDLKIDDFKPSIKVFSVVISIFYTDNPLPGESNDLFSLNPRGAPPPLSGRALLFFLNQLKIDTPVSN